MKNIKYLFLIIISFVFTLQLNAASFGMTSSTKEVKPNSTFTINVGGDCIGRVDLSVSNGTLSTTSVWVEQGYVSVTVTSGGSGVVTVTATPTKGFSDSDANEYNPGSRKVSVNISSSPSSSSTSRPSTPAVPKSSDNNLSQLTPSIGTLSPNFDSNVTEYTLNLESDVTKISINATPKDNKSKIDGIGEKELKPGNNIIELTVTAENGSTKVYKINAYVDETPQVYLNYKKEKIGIVRNYEGVVIPEGFTTANHSVDDKSITIFTKDKINIIYGINEKEEKSFYIINTTTNEITNKIIVTNITGKTLYIINDDSDKITINEMEVSCQEIKSADNYCILKTINSDEKMIDYLYEKTENGIIKYPDFINDDKSKTKNLIIYIISALLLMSISLNIYLLFKLIRGGNSEKTK